MEPTTTKAAAYFSGGLFLPFAIQELEIGNTGKLILSQINALGRCTDNDSTLAARLGIAAKTVSNNLTSLRAAGLLETWRENGGRVLRSIVRFSNLGSWLPSCAVNSADLTPTEKILIANVASLSKCSKGCIASNTHLAKIAGVTLQRVKDIISRLRSLGWLESLLQSGRRVISIAAKWLDVPVKNTCTSRKNDAPHSIENKEKPILAVAEKSTLPIDRKIESVIEKTGWLKSGIAAKGLSAAAIAADLLRTGFVFVSENAARAYIKDFLGRKDAAAAVVQHAAAAPIAERYKEFFKQQPSPQQLAKLCEAADKYGVHRVRYVINILGVNGDAFKFNAAAVVAELQKNYK